ncbi:MAG: thioredoxin [Dehalococcoidia bacterium]|nr:thioredoxin [Dehalococcoidia bacterium]MEC8048572.1 thioredoxin [Chloroflexota bacterium]|tara:strand:+ start:950 stop:1273 length:324 start_codon:yes stop_codon:yes gene_type:complete
MSNVIELNDSNFDDEVVKSDLPVLVDFWAEWCGPCKMIAPSVEKISEEYSDKLKVGKLDVDSNPNISSTFGIRSIPTLLIFKNGSPVDQIVGAVSKEVISAKVDSHI